mgnify:CR=1 FL=1
MRGVGGGAWHANDLVGGSWDAQVEDAGRARHRTHHPLALHWMLTARQVSAPSAMEAASAQFVAGAMSRLPGALTESGVSALPGVLSVRRPNMLGPIPRRGRSTPKVAEPRHEPRAQHAVALARSAKPGPRAKPVTSLIRMRPTSHPRRDTSRPICPKRSPPHPKQPIFTSSHQSGRRFEQQPDGSPPTQRPNMGGFATIGPRHAGDTPSEASYGRNSPRSHA